MKKIILSPFEIFSLAWISVATIALLLAIFHIFHPTAILAWIAVIPIIVVLLVKNKRLKISPHSKGELGILTLIITTGIFLGSFTTPTIFGGRDEGSLLTSAILISQNHSLQHSDKLVEQFFGVYGPGTALNFPGFFYTQDGFLQSQFLPAYPVWLATLYSFFGLTGIKFANLLPFVTFIFSFFLVLKRLANKPLFALLGTVILLTLFPITLFYKFTLTELFFAALIWLALHFVFRHLAEKSYWTFIAIFIPLIVTPFLRIEAVGFGFMLLLTLILLDFEKMKLPRYRFLFIVCGAVVTASFIINAHFFTETIKNFATISPITNHTNSPDHSPFSIVPKDWQNLYMLKILFNYNLLPLIILGFALIYTLFRKKQWHTLIPCFFLGLAFIYLIDANISLDHPWMLRRFIFAVIPLSLLYTMLLIERTALNKRLPFYIVIILITLNLSQSIPFATYSQNQTLLTQTQTLLQNFNRDDLLLISQKASGSGWSLLAEPAKTVLGKNAVYFFNQHDLAKIDTSAFKNIYLISSNSELENYNLLNKEKVQDYTLTNSIVTPSKQPLAQPSVLPTEVNGAIYKLQP